MHSADTALMKVVNYMCEAIDAGRSTLLGTLDMSATFDTIDH